VTFNDCIALKSYSGFYKYLDVLETQNLELDWPTIVGSFGGARIAKRLPQQKLKKGFGFFLIVMGVYILARSVPQVVEMAT
jgi:uncharacterized membrane protein YfcA